METTAKALLIELMSAIASAPAESVKDRRAQAVTLTKLDEAFLWYRVMTGEIALKASAGAEGSSNE